MAPRCMQPHVVPHAPHLSCDTAAAARESSRHAIVTSYPFSIRALAVSKPMPAVGQGLLDDHLLLPIELPGHMQTAPGGEHIAPVLPPVISATLAVACTRTERARATAAPLTGAKGFMACIVGGVSYATMKKYNVDSNYARNGARDYWGRAGGATFEAVVPCVWPEVTW